MSGNAAPTRAWKALLTIGILDTFLQHESDAVLNDASAFHMKQAHRLTERRRSGISLTSLNTLACENARAQ